VIYLRQADRRPSKAMSKALRAGFVRREALWFEWGWETFTAWSSQRPGRS
jgi:hypothetical protein